MKNILTIKNRNGYTIVELIVVIAIIGVLLSLSLSGISSARARSRDARRIADIHTIQTALEMYAFNDDSRSYPAATAGIYTNAAFKKYMATTPYDPLKSLPTNPQGSTGMYIYAKPACVTTVSGKSQMTTVSSATGCESYSDAYGLHASLETNNIEAKNDRSPLDDKSYDVMP